MAHVKCKKHLGSRRSGSEHVHYHEYPDVRLHLGFKRMKELSSSKSHLFYVINGISNNISIDDDNASQFITFRYCCSFRLLIHKICYRVDHFAFRKRMDLTINLRSKWYQPPAFELWVSNIIAGDQSWHIMIVFGRSETLRNERTKQLGIQLIVKRKVEDHDKLLSYYFLLICPWYCCFLHS